MPYSLAFLTDQWEWEADLAAAALSQAMAQAREALEKVVREEDSELACVTILNDGAKVGIWDWVAGQAYRTGL